MRRWIVLLIALGVAVPSRADDKDLFNPYSSRPTDTAVPAQKMPDKETHSVPSKPTPAIDANDLFAKPEPTAKKETAKHGEKETGGKEPSKHAPDDAMMADSHPDDAPHIEGIMVLVSNDDPAKTESVLRKYARIVVTRNIHPAGAKIMISKPYDPSIMERVTQAFQEEISESSPAPFKQDEIDKLSQGEIQRRVSEYTKGNAFVNSIMLPMLVEADYSIPAEMPVTKTPSWLFRTKTGDVILEGLADPQRYITKDGYFVEPSI